MIDFDVVTGPGTAEKPREPAPKPAARPPGGQGHSAAEAPGPEASAGARSSPGPTPRNG